MELYGHLQKAISPAVLYIEKHRQQRLLCQQRVVFEDFPVYLDDEQERNSESNTSSPCR